MIERVARAMIANDSGPEGSKLFEIHLEEFGEGYCSSARAAIEAMREPTAGMVQKGSQAGPWTVDRYTTMITAALEETQ